MTKRALIVKLGAIGDVIMALPAIQEVHRRGFEIDWLCGPVVAPLLRCYPWVHVIVVDDRALLKGSRVERLRTLARLWKVLLGTRYEICATLYYDARYRLLTSVVRSPRKLHLSRSERSGALLATRQHTDEYARILLEEEDSCRSESRSPLRPEVLPSTLVREKIAPVRVALVPGGASNMLRQQTLRRWPAERYVDLAEVLLRRGYEVLLLGGPEDLWVKPQFARLPVTDLVGTLSLPDVIAVCDTCDVVVSHDTGPLHLAGLSKASLLGLFGPTDPGNFLPRRPGARAIWGGEHFACRPCYDGRQFAPCRDNGCMQEITLQMVLHQVEALLAERKGGALQAFSIVTPSSIEAPKR